MYIFDIKDSLSSQSKKKNTHLENYSDTGLNGSSLQILTAICHLVPI